MRKKSPGKGEAFNRPHVSMLVHISQFQPRLSLPPPPHPRHICQEVIWSKKGILKAEQGGFRKMHGTVDSIFTLKILIDKCMKSKPQKHRNLLFSRFVDFRKAFDCIPCQKLSDKLRKEGVQGRFLDVLISPCTQLINRQLKFITN